MKIQYFSGGSWEEDYVRPKFTIKEEVVFHEGSIGTFPDLTDPDADVVCTFIESRIGEDVFKRFPKLKLIATRSTGFDHIDLEAAKAHGITISNVPFYGENTVAEFAFALILSLSRRIGEAHDRVLTSGTFSPIGLRGFDLAGKTIGIIGVGHIGAHMIRMAQGFGMKVIAYDIAPNNDLSHILSFSYVSLHDLLATSDVISIHVPYNKETHHLINRGNISKLKKGSYLINSARGGIVETQAIVEALKDGMLAGAGLDVLEEEGELSDEAAFLTDAHPNESALRIALENHYLIHHPRVIITPHLAFNTTEAVERILDTTVENIQQFGDGTPKNVVKN